MGTYASEMLLTIAIRFVYDHPQASLPVKKDFVIITRGGPDKPSAVRHAKGVPGDHMELAKALYEVGMDHASFWRHMATRDDQDRQVALNMCETAIELNWEWPEHGMSPYTIEDVRHHLCGAFLEQILDAIARWFVPLFEPWSDLIFLNDGTDSNNPNLRRELSADEIDAAREAV